MPSSSLRRRMPRAGRPRQDAVPWNLPALLGVLLWSVVCTAQVTITEQSLHGRKAWVLDNGVIRVVALRGGGHIGEIRFSSGDPRKVVNPFYVPPYHTEYPVLVGFLLPTSEHPWLVDWQSNRSERWMRGIEFGTSPFDEGLRKSVERGSLLGVPTYGWIGGGARLTVRYSIFLAEIPPAFRGVQNVEKTKGRIDIIERETGRVIRATTSLE